MGVGPSPVYRQGTATWQRARRRRLFGGELLEELRGAAADRTAGIAPARLLQPRARLAEAADARVRLAPRDEHVRALRDLVGRRLQGPDRLVDAAGGHERLGQAEVGVAVGLVAAHARAVPVDGLGIAL